MNSSLERSAPLNNSSRTHDATTSFRRFVAVGAFTVLSLFGCSTLLSKPEPAVHASASAPHELRLGLLSVGMSIKEVARIEPEPDRVVTMESQAMTVVEWVYEENGRQTKLYFTNGLLESW